MDVQAQLYTERQLGIFLTAGITNLFCLPAVYVVWRRGLIISTYTACFTFVTSLLYHCTDALSMQNLYLTPTQWHKLDNIGTIMGLVNVLIYLMDNIHYNEYGEPESRHEAKLDRHMNYCGLGLTLIMQTKDPWDIFNTYMPILIFLAIFLVRIYRRRPRVNKGMLYTGLGLLCLGVFFFSLGLDEEFDYYRVYHGLWHISAATSCFYLMQSVDKDKPHSQVQLVKLSKQERLQYWPVFKQIFSLQFLQSKPIKSI